MQRAGVDLAALADRHRPVVAALRARDGDAAAAAMQTHLEEAERLLAHPATTATEEHAA